LVGEPEVGKFGGREILKCLTSRRLDIAERVLKIIRFFLKVNPKFCGDLLYWLSPVCKSKKLYVTLPSQIFLPSVRIFSKVFANSFIIICAFNSGLVKLEGISRTPMQLFSSITHINCKSITDIARKIKSLLTFVKVYLSMC
jgi:hypothetical protein